MSEEEKNQKPDLEQAPVNQEAHELEQASEQVQATEESEKGDEHESKLPEVIPDSLEPAADTKDSASPSDAPSNDEHSQHITYGDDGVATYTDPKTNYKYKWCDKKNEWTPSVESAGEADPYENEHYKWCSETNQWIPKTGESKTETEFYKWDAKKNEWVPKTQESNDVVYGYEDGVRTYTDKDGAVFFWDTEKKAWFPKIDDDFMARYQMSYGFIDNTTPDVVPAAVAAPEPVEVGEAKEAKVAGVKRKAPAEPPKWFELAPEQNTKVYVSNLPLDITEEEFIEVMAKCGLIMRDPQSNKYKVKLYVDSNGQLKGDGLCDYIKVESVDLALNILDGYDVRGKKIKVQPAKFEMRGEYNPALKPKKKKKDKEKLIKLKEKLFDWRPDKMRGERSKHERVVIIKNLFTPELFDKEVQLIIDYQTDLREECGKCGTVRKVMIYDRHPEGVAQITMSDPEEADVVIQMMNGRFFGQRKLTADHWDGKTKYKIDETEEERAKRLSNWDKHLEEEEIAAAAAAAKAAANEKSEDESISEEVPAN